MNDDSIDISTPSPKSRRGTSSSSRGRGSGGAGVGRHRSRGLFGDIGGDDDGSNSGTSSRFAGMASPGGYGIMDILNNMDDDTHHFEDSNFDKVESPSRSTHREEGVEMRRALIVMMPPKVEGGCLCCSQMASAEWGCR